MKRHETRTSRILQAFLNHEPITKWKSDNACTDGTTLMLFDNLIAWWEGDELWISAAGWPTPTTLQWLMSLARVNGKGLCRPGDGVARYKQLYLGDTEWDGKPVLVPEELRR